MGSTTFIQSATGPTAAEAFRSAQEEAGYESGHGYSGTIVEKPGFVLATRELLWKDQAAALANDLLNNDDPRFSDKWGSAGAVAYCDTHRYATVVVSAPAPPRYGISYAPDWDALVDAQAKTVVKRGESMSPSRIPRSESKDAGVITRTYVVKIRRADAGKVTTQEVTVVVAGSNRDQGFHELAQAAIAAKCKVGPTRQMLSHHITKSEPKKITRSTVTSKGRSVRYVVLGVPSAPRLTAEANGRHDTFETGFATITEAKAFMKLIVSSGFRFDPGPFTVSVEAITRGADGTALASASVATTLTTVTATVELIAGRAAPTTTDGWVFFGWASS